MRQLALFLIQSYQEDSKAGRRRKLMDASRLLYQSILYCKVTALLESFGRFQYDSFPSRLLPVQDGSSVSTVSHPVGFRPVGAQQCWHSFDQASSITCLQEATQLIEGPDIATPRVNFTRWIYSHLAEHSLYKVSYFSVKFCRLVYSQWLAIQLRNIILV